MIPYGRQFIDEEDIKEVTRVLKSDYLTTGPKISEFEEKFAEYVGIKYAVAVSSGTAALHLACLAGMLEKDDRIITSPLTFSASANCALYCGAWPDFVDIDKQGLIDVNKIEKAITEKTKIIIPIDYSGLPCNMEEIHRISKKHNLLIIKDSCHALGAKYNGMKIGNGKYSDMNIFSFHPVKHVTTGEGGMITTNSKELYNKLKIYRTHGITKDPDEMLKNEGPWYYEMKYLGFNYRITDIQCALGISQLKKLDQFVFRRREIAKLYDEAFENCPYFSCLTENSNQISSFHLYPILLKEKSKRKRIFIKLREKGLGVQVHYIPVYYHPVYQKLGYKKGSCPNAEDFYSREISIPMYPSLTDEEVESVIKILFEVFKK
jgi:UDP-4-amino-4,6-dideoxy-N-acetyl-beta-L-altrosamine transaminase